MADRKGKWPIVRTYFLEPTPNQESIHGSKDMSTSMTRFWAYQNIGEGHVAEMRSQRNDHAIGEGHVAKI